MGLTFEAIDNATALAAKQALERPREPSGRIEASMAGHACPRAIWYGMTDTDVTAPSFDRELARGDGKTSTERMSQILSAVPGVTIESRDAVYYECNGKLRVTIDGIITGLLEAPTNPHVWHHRTCNEKKFDLFVKSEDVKHWDYEAYVKAQIAMHLTGCTRHYMTVSNPGLRDFHSCRIHYDHKFAKQIIWEAQIVADSETLPTANPMYYCNLCAYKGKCLDAA